MIQRYNTLKAYYDSHVCSPLSELPNDTGYFGSHRIALPKHNEAMDLLSDGSSDDNDDDRDDTRDLQTKPKASSQVQQKTKVLKLASILPPDVLQRLERNDELSSSDDDEEEDGKGKQTERNKHTDGGAAFLKSLNLIKPKSSSRFPVAAFTNKGLPETDTKTIPNLPAQPTPPSNPSAVSEPSAIDKPNIQSSFDTPISSHAKLYVAAAPRVQAAPIISKPSTAISSSSPPKRASHPSSQQQKHQLPSTTNTTSRKRRQNLERALRNGQIDVIAGTAHGRASTTVGDSTAVHVVDYEAAQTIRKVPTGVYDPETGKLSDAGRRSKGKNQVHVLVHQAAALERQRAEQLGPSGVREKRMADSKRKYGF